MLLKDKVIVISGVGPGMGQSLAKIAAAEGAKVGLGARNQAFLDQVKSEIEAAGGQAVALSTDIGNMDQCRALADATRQAFGRIDGLVNSAYAHGDWKTTDEADPEEFASVFNINCAGALRMAQACLSSLKETKGAIVNVSTMSTVNPFPGEGAYSAGKGGMNALTRHMAKDFGRHGIRVNVTRMGWIGGAPVWGHIDREVAAGRDRDEVIGEIASRIPLGIIPPEEDCAKAVLFMVSDYSKVVNGASLDVNGGQYMAP
ncbi:SDR family oxidoreductase [Sphingomonas jatrophae]|uniref:NAD(P)-dependent dehydrogenase, short-chain alcohol dehydrogenase family n=1 Tax=Sphingomonas jatrophae TaxID=1166337 RepID=A0A1I6KIS8_9SPHN|nr:SDR family oxidoreductase [Sphingomonas jatrophae]SFR90958.1 NAD(P)-dependent dehydrogenase, short-chain alcohol dehydrogenase family [Sphingomonas jatrophae]